VPVKEALSDFIDSGFMTYQSVEGTGMQDSVYKGCNANYRHLWNWIMYIDADEYVRVRDPYVLTLSNYQ
jgi:hypothetical protein